MNSAAVDCNAIEKNDLTFRQPSFPPDEFSAGRDRNYMENYIVQGFPKIDSAAADYGTGAGGLDDLIFLRTNLPSDEFPAGRNGDYIWRDLWTGPSVCNRSVTGSLALGSPHRLG